VGLDTFLPIREEVVEDHRIHTETWSAGSAAMRTIGEAVTSGSRLIAVGTTAARVLETLGQAAEPAAVLSGAEAGGATDIFITPGYHFRLVDALLTNFHLPKSSVLALTMAFAGRERIRQAYAEAISTGYRFFSFGDAILIEALAVGVEQAENGKGEGGADGAS
jgi:S-adenosylmethionine:tRNA ribosyltransferase-isomerase